MTVIDEDFDIRKLKNDDEEDDDDMAYAPREEKPSIAAIIDERPDHLIRKDMDRNRWRTLQSSSPTEVDSRESGPSIQAAHEYENKDSSRKADHERPKLRDRRRRDSDNDGDLSPPRPDVKRSHPKTMNDSDGDLSPPRAKTRHSPSASVRSSKHNRHVDDDDLSPPRPTPQSSRSRSRSHRDPERYRDHEERSKTPTTESYSRTDGGRETLSGKVAGLSDAKSVREEMKRLKEKEAHVMQQVGGDALGRNAKTVYRDRGTGRVRDLEAEAAVSVKTDKEEEERAARYKDWSQGLRQREERNDRLQQDLKEMDKPLARYEDDEDRDQFLKAKELDEDPMLQFVRRKKLKKKVREAAGRGEVVFAKPAYRGPPPPPNRFAILPGHRWDGVDRSNGYEKRLLDKEAETIAVQEEAYKWSTEDM